MKLKNIFKPNTTISAKATVDGATHDLNLELESLQETIYHHKIQFHCAIATTVKEKVNGRSQLVTAVSYVERELKRFHSNDPTRRNPETGEYLPWIVSKKLVTVHLDGNGDPTAAKYDLRNYIAQRRKEGKNYDPIYDETPDSGNKSYEATHAHLADDVLCNNKITFDSGNDIHLKDFYVEKIKEIGDFTRNNDTLFVFSVHQAVAGNTDFARNALSLIPMPAMKARLAAKFLERLIYAIGFSNFYSSSNFINHRNPVFITGITREDYKAVVDENDQPRYYEIVKQEYIKNVVTNYFEW